MRLLVKRRRGEAVLFIVISLNAMVRTEAQQI